MKLESAIENRDLSLTDRIKAWFESPEGQASIESFKKEREKEEHAKKRFADRVLRMERPEIDHWMKAIIAYYSSCEYRDKWYNRGIVPPCSLYDLIFNFIMEHGFQVGETKYGDPIYQYMSWKVDAMYGQGEAHYNFERTDDVVHKYGKGIFYLIRHNKYHYARITMLDNIISKSWDDAKYIIDEFCQICKMKDIFVCPADFDIVEVTMNTPEKTVECLKAIVDNNWK